MVFAAIYLQSYEKCGLQVLT